MALEDALFAVTEALREEKRQLQPQVSFNQTDHDKQSSSICCEFDLLLSNSCSDQKKDLMLCVRCSLQSPYASNDVYAQICCSTFESTTFSTDNLIREHY
jgi:hypothetical protein